MTLNDVKNDVAALGFEKEIEIDTGFLGAVNRALFQIFTERPSQKVMRLYPKTQKTALYTKEIVHNGGEANTFSSSGRAFAFLSFGKGELELTDEFGKRTFSFNGESVLTHAFTKGVANFKFLGEFCYTVRDFTLYSELAVDSLDEIVPLGELTFFDPRKYDSDFIGFCSYPYDENGILIEKSVIDERGLGIRLPYDRIININYRARPKMLTYDSLDEDIEITPECEHLLALLTAHYVWLDDDFTKAQHYLDLYRDGMNAVKYYSKDFSTVKYSTNGWA